MLSHHRLLPELAFSTSRSGGPGGQNVNKVESKVTLKWDIANSTLITAEEKQLLIQRLHARLTAAGILLLSAQESRSQLENKQRVLEKFDVLLASATYRKKARKATKATASSKRKRVQSKKAHGEKKRWRQRPGES